jgi:predicted nucleic acid-binding Zn ribbon protein
MMSTVSYAIVLATPDPRRGERVNVGIVVFNGDGLDVRMPGIGKISALYPGDYGETAETFSEYAKAIFAEGGADALRRMFDRGFFMLSGSGWFVVDERCAYEDQVAAILRELVEVPR